jgi:tRNA (guanine-N(7)-)-methyltransferase
MRRRNVKYASLRIANHPELVIFEPNDCKGKWQSIFQNNHPIYLEVGMGKGKFLGELALTHPEINYIGIEKFESVIVQAVEKIAPLHLNNIKLIQTDAEKLDEIFSKKELSKLFLNFSDPWPKNRHEKRRLTYQHFLEKYDNILDGTIEMKTDNRELFEYSLKSFNNNGWEFVNISLDLHNIENEEKIITTEYEDRFIEKGNVIYFIEVKKMEKNGETK